MGELDDVYLYGVDDLKDIVQVNLKNRQYAAKQAEQIIDFQAHEFMNWVDSLEAVSTIRALRGKAERIQEEVLQKALSKIKGGKLAVELHPAKIVNLILSDEREHKINAISSGPTVRPDNNENAIKILKENMLWEQPPIYIKNNLKLVGNTINNEELNIFSKIITGREKMIEELTL